MKALAGTSRTQIPRVSSAMVVYCWFRVEGVAEVIAG